MSEIIFFTSALLKNTFLGVLMFSLQVISTLILGILLKFFSKESDENQSKIFSKENGAEP